MINIGFPIFDLESTIDYVFIAGGGGSKEYGKENGVMAIKKRSLSNKAKKMEHFYKTNDLIIHLQVYSEKDRHIYELFSDIQLEDAPEIADGFESISEEMTIPFAKDFSSSEEQGTETTIMKEEIKPVKIEKKNIERKPSNAIFILAIGDDNLYILKFNNLFSLHCKVEKRVKYAFLNKHLFIVRNSKLQGFFDTIKNPSSVNFHPKKIEDNVSDPTEEYIYKLYRRRSEVIALNENCTRDIPKDWEGFFIFGNKIHKVRKEGEFNVFVFRSKKYEIPGKISTVNVIKETLVFYSNTNKEGNLYFIGNEDKVYKLARITTMGIWKNNVVVATQQGNAIIYQDGQYLQRMGSFNLPVTGLAMDESYLYYSLIDGQVDSLKRVSNMEKGFRIGVLISIFLSIFLYFILKYKK